VIVSKTSIFNFRPKEGPRRFITERIFSREFAPVLNRCFETEIFRQLIKEDLNG
jgi:hypothetical protein